MVKHVSVLGWLYVILGILGVLFGIAIFLILTGGGLLSGDPEDFKILLVVGTVVGIFLGAVSAVGIIAGYGLLNRKEWSRILALILGVLNLLSFPIGTALGIYSLWVLLNDEVIQFFRLGGES